MWVVSITKSSVDKPRVVYRSHLIKEVKGSFRELNCLFSRVHKVFHALNSCFVEVKHS